MHRLPLEFSRPLDITRVPMQGCTEKISADAEECAALAMRLGLPAIHDLAAELQISRWRGEGLKIKGRFTLDLEQTCVVSLDYLSLGADGYVRKLFSAGEGGQRRG